MQIEQKRWRHFLSEEELMQHDRAADKAAVGIAFNMAGFAALWGGNLLLGATVASVFGPVAAGGLFVYGTTKAAINAVRMHKLQSAAERREAEFEFPPCHKTVASAPRS